MCRAYTFWVLFPGTKNKNEISSVRFSPEIPGLGSLKFFCFPFLLLSLAPNFRSCILFLYVMLCCVSCHEYIVATLGHGAMPILREYMCRVRWAMGTCGAYIHIFDTLERNV